MYCGLLVLRVGKIHYTTFSSLHFFTMKLILPNLNYEQSWLDAIAEFNAEDRAGFWNFPEKPTDLPSYIERTEKFRTNSDLPEGWVPNTTYWLIDNDEFVGHINIRHELSDYLKKIGGHIGYAIRPTARQKGYGSKILELTLPKAKELGIKKALVTCDEDNIASRKIIERHGGEYMDTIEAEGKHVMRFWISLEE